jgi:hypothetical protein
VLPLVVLSLLVAILAVLWISLGAGLRGFVLWSTDPRRLADSSGRGDSGGLAASLPDPASVASIVGPSLAFTVFLVLVRLDIGSREMVRGLGAVMGPISTVSTREIFWSQVDVAAIEVGRVMVAVIM